MDDQSATSRPSADARGPSTTARRAGLWLLGVAVAILAGWALKAAASVAVPLTFALLVTLVLAPLDTRLSRALPEKIEWLAHLAVMIVMLVIIALFIGALVFAADRLLEAMPRLTDEVQALLPGDGGEAEAPGGSGGAAASLPSEVRSVWRGVSGRLGSWALDQATALATATAGMTGAFLSAIVLVFFLVLIALTELGEWRAKVSANWAGKGADKLQETFEIVTRRLRRFLVVRSAVGLLQAALYAAWLAVFGLDLLIVWAVLTFVLTYIPTLGSLIAGTLPVLYALLTKDFGTAIMVAAGIFAIEQVVGNFIDPRLMGRQIVLSPLVILASLLLWGWIWGAAGAFLATPLTLGFLVAFHQIDGMRPAALLLSNQPDHASLDRALSD